MCVGRAPKTPQVDPAIKAQQEADKAKALEEKKGAKVNKNCVSVRRLWENNVSTKPKRAHRKCSLWYYQRHAGTKKKAIVEQEQHPLSGMYKMSLCH